MIPGDSRGSALVQRITGVLQPSMPFEGPPLPAEEIARIKAWIDAGAPGAADEEPAEKRHWAYREAGAARAAGGGERGLGPEPDRPLRPGAAGA